MTYICFISNAVIKASFPKKYSQSYCFVMLFPHSKEGFLAHPVLCVACSSDAHKIKSGDHKPRHDPERLNHHVFMCTTISVKIQWWVALTSFCPQLCLQRRNALQHRAAKYLLSENDAQCHSNSTYRKRSLPFLSLSLTVSYLQTVVLYLLRDLLRPAEEK